MGISWTSDLDKTEFSEFQPIQRSIEYIIHFIANSAELITTQFYYVWNVQMILKLYIKEWSS